LFFTLLFIGIRIAGNIVGYQIGLMMANVMDPNTNSQYSMVSELYYLLAILIFLAIDGHHAVISALADSYRLIPVGVFAVNGNIGEQLIRFTAHTFIIGLKIGAPVIVTLFMTSVALGVVARTVPQMNIFLIGIPLKIIIGFAVIAVALPVTKYIIYQSLNYLNESVLGVMHGLGTS
jgi:flagellar biosynthetic protein FliR